MASIHLPFKVNNSKRDVYKVLSAIKPNWEKKCVQIKNLEGGYSCHMKHCSCPNDNASSISFRIRNLFIDSPLTDSDFELQVLKVLSKNNLFPRIYATFENGYCYEYVKGKALINFPLIRNSIRVEKKMLRYRTVATQLAEIHKIPFFETESQDYFIKLTKLLEKDFPKVTKLLSKRSLRSELKCVESFLQHKICNSSLVLSHGDLHIFNLLKKVDDSVLFLDWELTHMNHRAFDIAFFFQTLCSIGMAKKVKFKLPRNAERTFIKYYIQNCNHESTIDGSALYCEVQIYKLVVLLYLMITQSIYTDLAEMVSVNPQEYHQQLLADYLQKKAAIMRVNGLEE
uniref:ethanolamine kinase n=1 Tax=Strigamia maritima TaxID=126957 RepID=T1IKF8_STRMM